MNSYTTHQTPAPVTSASASTQDGFQPTPTAPPWRHRLDPRPDPISILPRPNPPSIAPYISTPLRSTPVTPQKRQRRRKADPRAPPPTPTAEQTASGPKRVRLKEPKQSSKSKSKGNREGRARQEEQAQPERKKPRTRNGRAVSPQVTDETSDANESVQCSQCRIRKRKCSGGNFAERKPCDQCVKAKEKRAVRQGEPGVSWQQNKLCTFEYPHGSGVSVISRPTLGVADSFLRCLQNSISERVW